MAKRLCSLFLSLVFLLPLFITQTTASGDVYVAINNAMLPITDAMPIRSDGTWYIDYQCFVNEELGVSGSYNPSSQTLALYTWDDTLAYDLNAGTATNIRSGSTYQRWAFLSNGTVYIPAQFTAKQLGLTYSFISSVNVIRIKNNNTVRDNIFAYIAKDEIPKLIDRYNLSKSKDESSQTKPSSPQTTPNQKPTQSNPSSSQTTPSNSQTGAEETDKPLVTVYLTFDVGISTDCTAILNTLSRFRAPASFFVFGSAIPTQDQAIRNIAVNGHTLGISAMGGTTEFLQSADSVKAGLSATNELLFDTCYTKSRLVRIPGSSAVLSDEQAEALIASGYRYWDWDLDASAMSFKQFVRTLEAKKDTVVIRFDASKNSIRNLSAILSHLAENNYEIKPISLLTTPKNERRDYR